MKKIISALAVIAAIATTGVSCKKGPGPGGKASITGKIWVKNYSAPNPLATPPSYWYATASPLPGYIEYYAQAEIVYIVYGDEIAVGDQEKTNYDGTYVFDFLRPGKYKIICYSKDTTRANPTVPAVANSKTVEVIQEVEISGKKDKIEMDDIVIVK